MSKLLIRFGEVLRPLVHGPPEASSGPPVRLGKKEFLDCIRRMAEEHLSDPLFTTSDAAEVLGMTRMHLSRKLRELTGQSTHEFIKAIRLEAARDLLPKPLPVSFIAHLVGYKSNSHFAGAFRKRFGVPPSQYRVRKPKVYDHHSQTTRGSI